MTRALRRLAGPAALVLLWWLSTRLDWVDARTLPSPGKVLEAGRDAFNSGELGAALRASLRRVLVGTLIGISAGLGVATIAGISRLGDDLLDSTMQVVKAVPTIALSPLLIVWLGIDEAPKLTLIALSTSMPIYMNTHGAIRSVDKRLVDAARTLGVRNWGLVRHVIAPAAVPGFLVGLRISLANAWLALIVAEQLNAKHGLGQMMADARSYFRLDVMLLVVVIYAALGLLSYTFVRLLERELLQWRRGFDGR